MTKPKIPEQDDDSINKNPSFIEFANKREEVYQIYKEDLRKKNLTPEHLLHLIAELEIRDYLVKVFHKADRQRGSSTGGMRNSPAAIVSSRLVPEAISALIKAGNKVTEKSIHSELLTQDKYPEAHVDLDGECRYLITDNSVRECLRKYRKETLFASKQRDL